MLSALKRATLPKEESVKVCHLHFDENCFERDLKVYITVRFFSPVLSTYNLLTYLRTYQLSTVHRLKLSSTFCYLVYRFYQFYYFV